MGRIFQKDYLNWKSLEHHPSPHLVASFVNYLRILFKTCPNHLNLIFSSQSELSQAVVDAGAVPLLVLCIQEPEIALKRIAASALSDISKHSPELAQTVVDTGAIAHLAQMILNPDTKLKVGYDLVSSYWPNM